MKYSKFIIKNYRAIENSLEIDISKTSLIPIVGINECGKTTILQAIYCFDFINDDEYGGKHLSDTKNLYKTSEKDPPIIAAEINLKYEKLNSLYSEFILSLIEEEKKNKKNEDDEEEVNEEEDDDNDNNVNEIKEIIIETPIANRFPNKIPILKNSFEGFIIIERNLNSKKYTLKNWQVDDIFNIDFHDNFCQYIIRRMPYILYNDDFMDRPPTSIKIPNNRPGILSGWLSIYERLFNSTNHTYSLFSIVKENDSRRRLAILSDVENLINKTLAKAWKTFLLSSHGSINVKLSISPNTDNSDNNKSSNVLDIKIVERIGNRERLFHVIDRSKGFLWFFNFVMKLQFNAKITADAKNTVYLLDEPGSYLHYTAQEKLCNKLVEISTNHGIVIYCTHSHTLLNPQVIPLNNIYIVEKGKSKQIEATPLPQINTKIENNNAYQPIHEALQISAFNYSVTGDCIIAVEGIYDKYSIELFIDLDRNISILPGTSADSIKKNIQFLNGFNKTYIAIWDNDNEGREHYNKAKKFFGEKESEKFDVLPKKNSRDRRMEEMIKPEDLDMMRNELGLDTKTSYERTISTLYFIKKDKRSRIINNISQETKDNFSILKDIINKRFNKSKELMLREE